MDFNPPRRDFILQMRKVNYTDAQLVKIWRINDYRVPNPSWDIYNVTTTPKAKGKISEDGKILIARQDGLPDMTGKLPLKSEQYDFLN